MHTELQKTNGQQFIQRVILGGTSAPRTTLSGVMCIVMEQSKGKGTGLAGTLLSWLHTQYPSPTNHLLIVPSVWTGSPLWQTPRSRISNSDQVS